MKGDLHILSWWTVFVEDLISGRNFIDDIYKIIFLCDCDIKIGHKGHSLMVVI